MIGTMPHFHGIHAAPNTRRGYGRRAWIALLAIALSGCSTLPITTDTAVHVTRITARGLVDSSRVTTDASITEPNTPRYRQTVAFVDSQRAQLSREAAIGGGEHIAALANLLGQDDAPRLGLWMQTHHGDLFTPQHDAADLVDRIAARQS